jgi:sigma-B regulation protein RsbU (phosphoserine phosphatase)
VPIIVSGGSTVRQLEEGGPPLGTLPDTEYPVEVTNLGKGDVLCLFTDGVTEAMNSDGDQFGVSRLIDTLTDRKKGKTREIGEAIVKAISQFSGLEHQADDLTLLIIKIECPPDI